MDQNPPVQAIQEVSGIRGAGPGSYYECSGQDSGISENTRAASIRSERVLPGSPADIPGKNDVFDIQRIKKRRPIVFDPHHPERRQLLEIEWKDRSVRHNPRRFCASSIGCPDIVHSKQRGNEGGTSERWEGSEQLFILFFSKGGAWRQLGQAGPGSVAGLNRSKPPELRRRSTTNRKATLRFLGDPGDEKKQQ